EGPKKVAMFRNTGMMIKEKGHFRTTVKFEGVFEAQGDPLNEKLRSLEPPGHDDWEPDRCDDPEEVDQAKSFLKKLNKWINDCVKQVIQAEQLEQVDAVGIGRFLPDDLDQDQPFDQDKSQTEPVKGEIEELRSRPPGQEAVRPEGGQSGPAGEGEALLLNLAVPEMPAVAGNPILAAVVGVRGKGTRELLLVPAGDGLLLRSPSLLNE
ncbi:MAG: hypothetical protein QME78_17765, partial [Thermodesulfobacteriota bacterium]|nr:hypothetical protein [Thermodesulfobacteriota bacterium]